MTKSLCEGCGFLDPELGCVSTKGKWKYRKGQPITECEGYERSAFTPLEIDTLQDQEEDK